MKRPRIGFRGQLLLGAVLPALLMVAILEVVFLDRYRTDIERSFIERGKAAVYQLGVAADFAFFSGSFDSLTMFAESLRQSDSDIVSVSVLGLGGQLIAGAGDFPDRLPPLEERLQVVNDHDHILIQAPIYQTPLPLDAEAWLSPLLPATAGRAIGYVTIELSRDRLKQRYAEMFRLTLLVILTGLIMAGWISARIAAEVLGKLEAARRQLVEQKELAEELARTDTLTGLANRRAFDEAVQQEIRRAQRYDEPLALILTDIDYFKKVNDTYGHHVGDQVLVGFARTLQDSVRDVDRVGRWGGEEFVILLPGTSLEEATLAAERMRLAVAGSPIRVEGATCGFTASFGVARFSTAEPTLDAMLGRADTALYRAKSNGRNRVEVG